MPGIVRKPCQPPIWLDVLVEAYIIRDFRRGKSIYDQMVSLLLMAATMKLGFQVGSSARIVPKAMLASWICS